MRTPTDPRKDPRREGAARPNLKRRTKSDKRLIECRSMRYKNTRHISPRPRPAQLESFEATASTTRNGQPTRELGGGGGNAATKKPASFYGTRGDRPGLCRKKGSPPARFVPSTKPHTTSSRTAAPREIQPLPPLITRSPARHANNTDDISRQTDR